MWASILDSARRYGRDTRNMRLVVRGTVKLTDAPLGADRPEFVGSLEEVRGDIERTAETGADELLLELQGATRTLDEMFDVAAALTAGVLAVR
jgi:hypothetical protein